MMGKGAMLSLSESERYCSVGLDIGSSGIVAVVLEQNGRGQNEMLGESSINGMGIRNGMVSDMDRLSEQIRQVCEDVSRQAGSIVAELHCNLSAEAVQYGTKTAQVGVRNQRWHWLKSKVQKTTADEQPEVCQRTLDDARTEIRKQYEEVIYDQPMGYSVQGQRVENPIGLRGQSLEVECCVVSADSVFTNNLRACIKKTGCNLKGLYPTGMASARAVLSQDEKELGVCVVDIDAHRCEIAVYHQGRLLHLSNLSLGGRCVDEQIAQNLICAVNIAEQFKWRYGCAWSTQVPLGTPIPVARLGGRKDYLCQRQELAKIIEGGYRQIFQSIAASIGDLGLWSKLGAGLVFTGQSLGLEGLDKLAEDVFRQAPVRLGYPILGEERRGNNRILQTRHSAAVGAALMGVEVEGAGLHSGSWLKL